MHVLYDHQTFCLQKYGGVSRYFIELIGRMAATDGVQASLYAGLNIDRYGLDPLRPNLKHFYSRRRPPIPFTAHLFNSINRIPLHVFLRRIERVDIYHPTYFLPISPPSSSTRTILTVHDMTHERLPKMFSIRDRTSALKAQAVQKADAIICDSNNTKRDLIEILKVPEQKCTVVYLGNSLKAVEAPSLIERPYFLFVGPRDRYKNFTLVAQAFSQIVSKDKQALLVCFGGGPFSRDEQSRFQELGIASCVRWMKGEDRTVATLYQHALALAYPSLSEGFGLPPLEAMALGCPVLTCNLTSIPEVVGDAAIYVDSHNPDHLASQLDRLRHDPGYRAKLSAAGRERAALFSWDRMARETLDVYRTVL